MIDAPTLYKLYRTELEKQNCKADPFGLIDATDKAAWRGLAEQIAKTDHAEDFIDVMNDIDREKDKRDAERWREAIRHIGATANHALGHRFTASCLDPIPGADLMQGGISQHFTEAIDASIAARKAAK